MSFFKPLKPTKLVRMVLAVVGGRTYHNVSGCRATARALRSHEMKLDDAETEGLRPCRNCTHGGTTTVCGY